MQKMTPENLAFSVNFISLLNDWYSQNPHAQLSSKMYISFRLSSILRPHCPPKDTQVTVSPEIRHTGVFTSCLSPTTVSIVRTYTIPYCDTRTLNHLSVRTLAHRSLKVRVAPWLSQELISLLSEDVRLTIGQLKNKKHETTRKKKRKIRGKRNVRFGGFRKCVKTVNRRHIHAYYVPSLHATWLKVVYSASSQNGEHADMNNKEQISFFLRMENLHRHFSPV